MLTVRLRVGLTWDVHQVLPLHLEGAASPQSLVLTSTGLWQGPVWSFCLAPTAWLGVIIWGQGARTPGVWQT